MTDLDSFLQAFDAKAKAPSMEFGMMVPSEVVAALVSVARAARTPDCNFSQERECGTPYGPDGFVGVYQHHPTVCPAGRLAAALKQLEEAAA